MPVKARKSKQPIVWAIDPYETKSAHRSALAKFLKMMSRGLSRKILPFSVVSPGGLTWPIPVTSFREMDLVAFGQESVRGELKKLHLPNVGAPTVELHESGSRRELVNDVLRFSKKNKAGFIAVNTRRLLSPFPFKVGGFVESLIGKSNIPVIAVSPRAKIPSRIKNILFPSDFSAKSHRAFRKTVELARQLDAKIHLLHLETPPQIPYAFTDVPMAATDTWYVEAEEARLERSRRLAQRWQQEAEQKGVRCDFQLIQAPVSLSKAILQGARKQKADLISLASYRSRFTPALIGGTVRDVLSATKTPVLEIRAG